MATKREWVLDVFKGKKTDTVPVGFWHHFTTEEELYEGFNNPEIFNKNLQGHQKFVKETNPDFIKLMSDGFFKYPNDLIHDGVTSIKELAEIEPLGDSHPWYDQQVDLVKHILKTFPEELATFYNIFAPATYLKWQVAGEVSGGDDILANFIKEDPELTKKVLDTIGEDIAVLVQKIIKEAGADGIYISVQNIQDSRIGRDDYERVIAPSERFVLQVAVDSEGVNILHICGYEGATNDVTYYLNYPANVINWAVGLEGISLSEGRKLFGNKVVLGGFENTDKGILYKGTKEEVQTEVEKLLKDAGSQGTVIGADCTIPADIDPVRIQWVKEALGI